MPPRGRAKSGAKVLLFFEICKFIAYNHAIYLRNRLQRKREVVMFLIAKCRIMYDKMTGTEVMLYSFAWFLWYQEVN